MSAFLSSLATAVPRHRYRQSDILLFMQAKAPEDLRVKRSLASVYQHSGIGYRHSVLPDFDLGHPGIFDGAAMPSTQNRMALYTRQAAALGHSVITQVAERLAEAGKDLGHITHLVWVSCTGLTSPGLETAMARQFPFKKGMQTTAFNFLGCHGFFHALRYARAMVEAQANANVLIVCVELCTLHFQARWHTDQILANALFADGGAGVVVSARPLGQNGVEIIGQSQAHLPDSETLMMWNLGDTGFDMRLSQDLPQNLERSVNEVIANALLTQKMTRDEIVFWLFHPGGKRILDRLEAALALNPGHLTASRKALEMVGNVSSATILFALKAFLDQTQPQASSQNGIMLGIGPGLVLETAFFRC